VFYHGVQLRVQLRPVSEFEWSSQRENLTGDRANESHHLSMSFLPPAEPAPDPDKSSCGDPKNALKLHIDI